MSVGKRPLFPVALVAVLGGLTGAAAWLGVSGSPNGHAMSDWHGFVSSTIAAGTLDFRSVVTTTGASNSVERATGVVDFSNREASEVSVVRGPGSPAQWNQIVVVGGAAYERPGTDHDGSGQFTGVWTPLSSFVLPPFAPLSGRSQAAALLGGPTLRFVTTASIDGVPTTEYQLTPEGITCVRGNGDQRSENVSSSIWVDGTGRIVQFVNLTAVAVTGVQSAVLTVTRFDRFGTAVAVDPPAQVSSAPAAIAPVADPLAGCLLTPG